MSREDEYDRGKEAHDHLRRRMREQLDMTPEEIREELEKVVRDADKAKG